MGKSKGVRTRATGIAGGTGALLTMSAIFFWLGGCGEVKSPSAGGGDTGGTVDPDPVPGAGGGPGGVGGSAGVPTGTGGSDPTGGGVAGTTGAGGGAAGAGGTIAEPPRPVVIFDDTRVHEMSLTMSPEDWDSIIQDSRGDEWRRATFTYDGVTAQDVGVRPSGESSRVPGNRRMSVRLKFDAFTGTGKFGGLEELKLDGMWDDGSLMRERLSYFVFRQFMPAPNEVHGRLTVNGELRGLYGVEEVWDDESVKVRFPQPMGLLYRIRGLTNLDPYAYMGMDPALYVPIPWDAKGMRPMEEHVVIGNFLRVVAEAPTMIEQVTDVNNLLHYFVGNTIITNTDGFTGTYETDDHFQYYDPSTGKFYILPWDPDNSWGSINDPADRGIYKRFSRSILTRWIRDTYEIRHRYKDMLAAAMVKLPVSALHAEADRVYQQIRQAAYEDPTKPYPNDHFDWSLTYIKDFMTARYADIAFQLSE
jgi:hypothetical protein